MKKKSNLITIISVILLVLALVSTIFLNDGLAGRISSVITIVTAIIGAVALFFQFKRDKDINEVSFILNLSEHFYDQTGPKEIMSKLEKYRKGDKNALTEDDYDNIVSYLEWCEEFAFGVLKCSFNLDSFDDLMSYRFFLATNNEYIQKLELIPCREFYNGIFKLHKKWCEYKRTKNLPILMEETGLEKVENYIKIEDVKKK